jgi:hypothetical protein
MKNSRSKLYSIAVRRYLPGQTHYGSPRFAHFSGDAGKFIVSETIKRTLRAEQIGNFSPLFCRYANKPRVLVHSDAGDLSDPFRRSDEYAASLFIEGDPVTPGEVIELRSAGLLPT